MEKSKEDITVSNFYQDIRCLIDETRFTVATTVSFAMTMLYWQIGKRINEEILKGKRAGRKEGKYKKCGNITMYEYFKLYDIYLFLTEKLYA
ncbi:MAG: DUF1016 domain-containing protein [Planctomycetes bacterium]|nr:DUF1016 domain-containing protein [Planctomycetota bacterium]